MKDAMTGQATAKRRMKDESAGYHENESERRPLLIKANSRHVEEVMDTPPCSMVGCRLPALLGVRDEARTGASGERSGAATAELQGAAAGSWR